MSEIHIVRDYPHPPVKVWRAMTDPDLIPYWTSTGKGARAVGFEPEVGNHFRFVAKPMPGWRGIVDCEVLEVRERELLRYTWVGAEGEPPSEVRYLLEPTPAGTRFTYHHTGFTGLGGFAMARLLGAVRRRMLTTGLPALLADLDDAGALRVSAARRGPAAGR
ncbi:SRPBCC domain-containing protein [Amycolatopsis sp. FBCC-B4732]|uniref:SRPBCC family protein n=1 Tax=Amycolatopsis sp. FBCC-B4732 TaxID=3079339 RepID=UPI001FF597DD|nr:SRPBCC domain-containing protein [Amycolatopsis sp. FBCC-B4732]UOX92770.1 SRPBCC domain-containing protein [Amycolatopsis sp. FBCC-B4732]